MEWIIRTRLVAEADRELQHRHRMSHQRWTAKLTAQRLKMAPSTLSMYNRLNWALYRYPDLKRLPTARAAYDALQRLKRRKRHATTVRGGGR